MLPAGAEMATISLKQRCRLPVVDLTQIISVWPACVYNMPVIAYPPWYMRLAMTKLYFT